MPSLTICLLEDFQVLYNDAPVTGLTRERLQLLVAFLALSRSVPQSRQHLAFVLWPDSREEQARTNLRNLLYYLRQQLPQTDRFLEITAQTVSWRDDTTITVDTDEFETAMQCAAATQDVAAKRSALARAVDLYTGDLLPKLYADWLDRERERLQGLHLQCLEQLVHLLEKEGEVADALVYAQRLLRADPLREESYRLLMELHARGGDRAAAVHVYHTCARVLLRELDVDPSPPTRGVYETILNRAESAVADSANEERTMHARLVGRQKEWRQLTRAWQSATKGRARLLLITGEAGIGKTRLAEELLDQVRRQGGTVARTQSYPSAASLAYAPVIDWMRSHALRPALSRLDEVWLVELSRLMPELRSAYPTLPSPAPLTAEWQRQNLLDALCQAIQSCNRPLLLLLDDLQWVDQGTLDWLAHFLTRHGQAPVLLLATLRNEELEPEHSLHGWRSSLQAHRLLSEIPLQPLDWTETAALGAALSGRPLAPALAHDLYTETEGNPLFIVETVRAHRLDSDNVNTWAGEDDADTVRLPRAILGAIRTRLTSLSPQARQALAIAAVAGIQFAGDVLALASQLDEEIFVRALDELWRRRIIRELEVNTYGFTHGKLRTVAYAEISPARRQVLHRHMAQALCTVHASNREAISDQLARHYEHAGMTTDAIQQYEIAGQMAQRLFSNREAVHSYRQALRLWQSSGQSAAPPDLAVRLYTEIGELLQPGGDAGGARKAFRQALSWVPAAKPIQRADLLRRIGKTWDAERQYDQALQLYADAEAALGSKCDASGSAWWREWLQIQLERAWVCYWLDRYEEAKDLTRQVEPIIEQHGTLEQRISFYLSLAGIQAHRARYRISDAYLALVRRGLAISLQLGDPGHIAWARFTTGFYLLWHGDLEEAREQMEGALEMARQRGDAVHQSRCLTYLTILYRRWGDVVRARDYATQSLEAAKRANMPEYQACAHANQAWLAWRAGDYHLALVEGEQALAIWQQIPELHASYVFRWTALLPLMAALHATHQPDAAVEKARELLKPGQMRLPDELEAAVQDIVTAWDHHEEKRVAAALAQALTLAQELGYL